MWFAFFSPVLLLTSIRLVVFGLDRIGLDHSLRFFLLSIMTLLALSYSTLQSSELSS